MTAANSSSAFANLPPPPYYAVVFSSLHTHSDPEYGRTADRMVELAAAQPGFLGVESTRGPDGFGITVSYWADLQAIAAWRAHAEHRLAQEAGKSLWYDHYEMRIARVERAYSKHL
jgi:heme-degrading monooxygenase HmoA